jgi:hypothetical protein
MKACLGYRRRSHGRARAHWWLIPLAVLACLTIAWLVQPSREAPVALLAAPASADSATDYSALAPTGAGPRAAAAPAIDHSVVESKQLADEPDMTGASIGAYGP